MSEPTTIEMGPVSSTPTTPAAQAICIAINDPVTGVQRAEPIVKSEFIMALASSIGIGIVLGVFAVLFDLATQKDCSPEPSNEPTSMPSLSPMTDEISMNRVLRGGNPFPMQWSECAHGNDVPPVGLFVTVAIGGALLSMVIAALAQCYELPTCPSVRQCLRSINTVPTTVQQEISNPITVNIVLANSTQALPV